MLKSNNVPTNAHKATGDSILKTNLAVKCIFDKLRFIKNETASWKLTCLELCYNKEMKIHFWKSRFEIQITPNPIKVIIHQNSIKLPN